MVHNIADTIPGAVAVALKATRTPANWVTISAITANAADIRIGDSTTSATSGIIVPKGTSATLWAIGDTQYLDLAQVFCFASGTDKYSAVYGTH
jgi:predicted RecA/RadA family phage recombinase